MRCPIDDVSSSAAEVVHENPPISPPDWLYGTTHAMLTETPECLGRVMEVIETV
jgi:hypothetical protein